MLNHTRAMRVALLAASSLSAVILASPASAADAIPTTASTPSIIVNNNMNPNATGPNGALDTSGVTIGAATGVNGVGQMTIATNPSSTALLLCTGTLINPRTVIFNAHCVNEQPTSSYGKNGTAFGPWANGTPMAFGFGANNLPALFDWFGLTGNPALKFNTNTNRALYEVEQVWYDQRSLAPSSCTNPASCFLEADIAIATLDTPAFGVPTWAMLFSPLTAETHATVTGYGVSGTSSAIASIDFRRRAAENMVSTLSSLDDQDDFLFGENGGNPQSLYQLDFDSPAGAAAFNTTAGRYDFDIYDGAALPHEGITAGGDSGGPLIVDQKYSRPVIAGTLSGGSRFFNGQASGSYGTTSFYQPLFLFWDQIVANNPYVYAGNKAGNGNWEDGSHWVSLMDPSYMVDRNGVLVNDLPDTPALGVSGNTVKFGNVCFLDFCEDLSQDDEATGLPVGSGTGLHIPGGPGSTNFVPNNIVANPKAGINARYYNVTLSAAGTTTLSSSATIDELTLNGPTKLSIAGGGSLNVLGDITQVQGWTNVDGLLKSGSDMLFATGFLTGSGTLQSPFVTVAMATVAPGGADHVGTMTINGNAILASGSSLFIDAQRGSADKLVVTGGVGSGILTLSQNDTTGAKPSIVFNKVTDAPAPRAGESYVIASGTGGISGTFGNSYTFQGVLRPELTYGPNTITATLRAGSLVTILDGQNATAIAFANALDHLRTGFTDKLWTLYGNVDWMNGSQLNATFNALAPSIINETGLLQDRQSRQLFGNVSDRLSMLGTGQAKGFSFSGGASALAQTAQVTSPEAILGLQGSSRPVNLSVGGGLSGFVTMSSDETRSSYGDQRQLNSGQHSRYFASGIEAPFGDTTFGTAVGYAESSTSAGSDVARSKLTQAAVYASHPVGKSAYVGAILAAERASSDSDRLATDTSSMFRLSGASHSSRYMATAEAGFRSDLGHGLSLNPRAQLGYSRYSLGGFHEQGAETALELNSLRINRLEARAGAKLDGMTHIAGWTVRPQVQADYVRLVSGSRGGMNVSFAAAPDYDFALPLTNGGSGWVEVKGGVSATRGAFSLGLSGQATAGDAPISDQRGLVSLGFHF